MYNCHQILQPMLAPIWLWWFFYRGKFFFQDLPLAIAHSLLQHPLLCIWWSHLPCILCGRPICRQWVFFPLDSLTNLHVLVLLQWCKFLIHSSLHSLICLVFMIVNWVQVENWQFHTSRQNSLSLPLSVSLCFAIRIDLLGTEGPLLSSCYCFAIVVLFWNIDLLLP